MSAMRHAAPGAWFRLRETRPNESFKRTRMPLQKYGHVEPQNFAARKLPRGASLQLRFEMYREQAFILYAAGRHLLPKQISVIIYFGSGSSDPRIIESSIK